MKIAQIADISAVLDTLIREPARTVLRMMVCVVYRADDGEYYYGDETTKTSLTLRDFLDRYPVYLDPLGHSDQVYVLEPKSNQYLTSCESIFNRALA